MLSGGSFDLQAMDTTPFIAQSWPYKMISIGYVFDKHAGNDFFYFISFRFPLVIIAPNIAHGTCENLFLATLQ